MTEEQIRNRQAEIAATIESAAKDMAAVDRIAEIAVGVNIGATKWASAMVGACLMIALLIFGGSKILAATPLMRDSTDAGAGWFDARSGMSVYTDHMTGCQYLGVSLGGLTPRLDAKGYQIGCTATK